MLSFNGKIMNPAEVTIFLIILALMLTFARGLGEAFRLMKQPMIVGEILAGIILGPSIFGTIAPDTFNYLFNSSEAVNIALSGFSLIGVVMLLIVSGLEVDLSILVRQSKVAIFTSVIGMIFTFSIGFAFAYLFPAFIGMSPGNNIHIFSLFIATALSITALPVIAKILMDLNLFKSEIGYTVIASAMFIDIIGWIIFSILLSMLSTSGHGLSLGYTIFLILFFTFFMLVIGRKIFNRIIPIVQNKFSFPGSILNLIFIVGFIGAAFTEFIGVHAIFGAFIIGIAIGDSAHLKENTREIIQQFVTNIFAPLFFVSIGLRVNFILHFDFFLTLAFIVIATVAKVAGCSFGARLGGMNKYESLAVGFGLNAHGAMEIILGLLALEYNLITEKTFVALVMMAIVTSIISGPLMAVYAGRIKKLRTFKGLLQQENIYITTAVNKLDVIKELCSKAADKNHSSAINISERVIAREESLSTGLVNGLAIPHAKLNMKEPSLLCALSKTGIDFDSLDGKPAHIIFLLLTPELKPELQLQLLSEIAKPFSSDQLSQIVSQSPHQFYEALLKKL